MAVPIAAAPVDPLAAAAETPVATAPLTVVVPVAVTAAESVERLRTWASGRCLSAYKPGIYLRNSPAEAARSGRRVARAREN